MLFVPIPLMTVPIMIFSIVLVITSVVSFFPAFVLVGARLRDAPPATSDLMAVLGANRRTLLRRLLLPHAVPGLLVALRLTASSAVLAAMLAEYLMGGRGLGALFAQSVSFHQVDRAWGTALVATAVSVACFVAAHSVGNRPETPVGANEDRVLVDLAFQARVGPAGAVEAQSSPSRVEARSD